MSEQAISATGLLYQRVARLTAALRRAERVLRRAAFTLSPALQEEIRSTRRQARQTLGYQDKEPWKRDSSA